MQCTTIRGKCQVNKNITHSVATQVGGWFLGKRNIRVPEILRVNAAVQRRSGGGLQAQVALAHRLDWKNAPVSNLTGIIQRSFSRCYTLVL